MRRSARTSALLGLLLCAQVAAGSDFVGSTQCAACHADAAEAWAGSHHQRAMLPADQDSVLGDFDDAQFTHDGVTSRFFRRDGRFMVNTQGADGAMQDFEIRYAFGWHPLQQYLVSFDDGRLQALGIAWDTRPGAEGGQRWFHLYPDESIPPGDPLHWTGLQFNANHMCIDCHSTDYRKRYSGLSDRFRSNWSEAGVACESCHGPGAAHVAWAGRDAGARESAPDRGLALRFEERHGISWPIDAARGTATRSRPNTTRTEIGVCASCHSRRSRIAEGQEGHADFLQYFTPALLNEGLYYPDGQIRDEVYVWGSFTQSRMFAAGVTCSDCHDPHSQQLRAPGQAVCAQCHAPSQYDNPEHHHHAAGSAGADCLDCHMPETTYMVVDPRRDHSLRVPRPDHSATLGTPNACNRCHADRDAEWAADSFRQWYPEAGQVFQDWGGVFKASRDGGPAALPGLLELARDEHMPAIARATAVSEMDAPPRTLQELEGLVSAIGSGQPLVRLAAAWRLEWLEPEARLNSGWVLLDDPERAVRIEAARVLAPVMPQLSGARRSKLESVLSEYIQAQELHADRPEAQVNLGSVYRAIGEHAQAGQRLRKAISLDPQFAPAYVNLADLLREGGDEAGGIRVLEQGLGASPRNASLHHALGLARVRDGQADAALAALAAAVELAPGSARFAFVYGIALNSTGSPDAAIQALTRGHAQHPADRDLLFALATINRDLGRTEEARAWAQQLVERDPDDEAARALLNSMDLQAPPSAQ